MKVYIDESKKNGFIIVAAAVVVANEEVLTHQIRALTEKRGGRAFHMVDEDDATRHAFLKLLRPHQIDTRLYDAGHNGKQLDQRRRCLNAVVDGVHQHQEVELIIDRDDTLLRRDRNWLYQAIRRNRCEESISHRHSKTASDNLLAIPDAIAWAYKRDKYWRKQVLPLITKTIKVP